MTYGAGGEHAAGGHHSAQGFNFRLPFAGQETANAQSRWVCCQNCAAMFSNGAHLKGRCAANKGFTRDPGHKADTTSNTSCRMMFR